MGSWEPWAAIVVLIVGFAGALFAGAAWAPAPDPIAHPAYLERLERIRAVWGQAERHTAAGCPTVAELERLMGEPVSATERDYAGMLAGVKCRR